MVKYSEETLFALAKSPQVAAPEGSDLQEFTRMVEQIKETFTEKLSKYAPRKRNSHSESAYRPRFSKQDKPAHSHELEIEVSDEVRQLVDESADVPIEDLTSTYAGFVHNVKRRPSRNNDMSPRPVLSQPSAPEQPVHRKTLEAHSVAVEGSAIADDDDEGWTSVPPRHAKKNHNHHSHYNNHSRGHPRRSFGESENWRKV